MFNSIMSQGIRLSPELREEIRRLQGEGFSDYQIAKMINLPYSTVYCQRPEVKERKREYMRKYFERPDVKERMKEYVWLKKIWRASFRDDG